MSSIFFLALQCCQCSTMQVKQRKKNSKSQQWSCVVCNQKQSIRKVFAEGPMAKDLRLFVQSFNMSRHHSHSSQPLPTATAEPLPHGSSKRPRSDWTEFLDPDEEIPESDPKPAIDSEVEIITELPAVEPFKKAKPNKYRGRDELHKPVFAKRSASKEVILQNEDREHDKDEKKLRKGPVREESSKWSQYLTGDDNCNEYCPVDEPGDELLESTLIEELVEDDEIHPDFLRG